MLMPTQNESNCNKLLKGLQRSPRIVTDANAMNRPHVFTFLSAYDGFQPSRATTG